MKVSLSQEELRLIDPEQYQEKYAGVIPDYEERIRMTAVEKDEARSFQF